MTRLLILAGLLLSSMAAHSQVVQLATTGMVAPQLAGTGSPAASYVCGLPVANVSYIQTDATNGRLWICDQLGGVWGWEHLLFPVATGTTAVMSSTALILGGCLSAPLTVTIPGATVGVNSATASPIGQPTTTAATAAMLNTAAWVSAANTVSVAVCALGTATTAAVPFRVLMY